MALVRRLVELGRSARAEAKVKTRQPLRRALVASAAYASLGDELRAEVAAELNVERVESFSSAGDLVDHRAKGNFRKLGKRFGKQTPVVAAAIAAADADRAGRAARDRRHGDGRLSTAPVELTADDVIVTERPREGWSVVNEHGETMALDLHLTPELRPGRPGPRGRPAGPGGPQDQRLRGLRPDRCSAGRRRRDRRRRCASTPTWSPARCWRSALSEAADAGDGLAARRRARPGLPDQQGLSARRDSREQPVSRAHAAVSAAQGCRLIRCRVRVRSALAAVPHRAARGGGAASRRRADGVSGTSPSPSPSRARS